MKYVVILAAVLTMAVGCQNQKTVVNGSKYKPLNEVPSVSMDAQNYNTKMRPMKDTMLIVMPDSPSQYRSFNEVKGIDMGAQNYNNRRFSTDTIYFKSTVDSLKN